jgi:ribonucleoside-diphosphate reductase alpha chain
MFVIKRNGKKEEVSFDKVLARIKGSSQGLVVNPTIIAQKVLTGLKDGIHTQELDELATRTSISLTTTHPDYGTLASRIAVSNHQKNTEPFFSKVVADLANQTHPATKEPYSAFSETFVNTVKDNADAFDSMIDDERDFLLDYFGFKTLERAYLYKGADGRIRERPQHLWMRVAVALWGSDLEKVKETYETLSLKKFIHATPTLFNAGTHRQQMSSCYLLAMDSDSINGIYKTLGDCAAISKYAGGIGLHIHDIRAKGSIIRGTNGVSNGIVPMLRVFNNTARYVDQGGGKRNGSFAIYLEPWHADIEDFLKLKTNQGAEEDRARDLFYALWVPDLFMKRVEAGEDWSLFCPAEAPGLADVWGVAFEELYTRYEREGRARKTISAQKLWFKVLESQIETGTPYLLYKDAANAKSNQQNLGTIKSSNLCTEIIEYSSPEETAVCNLASISLPAFIKQIGAKRDFDFDELRKVTKMITRNLNKVIDINYYPTPETKKSNMRHRPIGIGVQGLADVFAMLRMPWESDKASQLNQKIFAHIYYAALEASAEIANEEGAYETFAGSPASEGRLQPDMWGVDPVTVEPSLDWDGLREKVKKGIRNSLLLAPMPTASTSQILGNTEAFEPTTSNIYTRRTLAGEFIIVNKYLLNDLMRFDVWNDQMKQRIIANNGSIQNIPEIPTTLQNLYKTAWEIKQKTLLDMAADRGAFICQSQSLNLFMADPTFAKLTSMHFYGWKRGLKTGQYYLRSKAPVVAQKFTVDPELQKAVEDSLKKMYEADEGCLMCGS